MKKLPKYLKTNKLNIFHINYICNHHIYKCNQQRYHNALTNNLDTII